MYSGEGERDRYEEVEVSVKRWTDGVDLCRKRDHGACSKRNHGVSGVRLLGICKICKGLQVEQEDTA